MSKSDETEERAYIKYTTFLKCPVHEKVRDECLARLVAVGYFEKEAVLRAKGLSTMANSIQWHFIQQWLDEKNGARVVPVSSAFFRLKDHYTNPDAKAAAELRLANPARCLASGHGKRTAGYVAVTFQGGVLAQTKLEIRKKVAVGTAKSASAFEGEMAGKGLTVSSDRTSKALARVSSDAPADDLPATPELAESNASVH